jgi:hypothetical protein
MLIWVVAHHSERNKNIRTEIVPCDMAPRSCYLRQDSADLCLSGKSPTLLSSPICKNIPSFHRTQITGLFSPSHPSEGRIAIVTDAGWDAVDADALWTNGA